MPKVERTEEVTDDEVSDSDPSTRMRGGGRDIAAVPVMAGKDESLDRSTTENIILSSTYWIGRKRPSMAAAEEGTLKAAAAKLSASEAGGAPMSPLGVRGMFFFFCFFHYEIEMVTRRQACCVDRVFEERREILGI